MSSRTRLIVMSISAPVIAFAIVGGFLGKVMAREDTYQHLKIFDDVVSLISSNYVEEADIDKVMRGAMRGLADGLDPDSAYLTVAEVKQVESGVALPPGGVGLELTRQYYLRVIAARDNSPAAKAGLRTGDYIRAINDKPTREMSVWEGQRVLRGAPGSKITLTVIRGNAADPHAVELTREAPPAADVVSRTAAPGVGRPPRRERIDRRRSRAGAVVRGQRHADDPGNERRPARADRRRSRRRIHRAFDGVARGYGHVRRRGGFRGGARRQPARRVDWRAHDRPRGVAKARQVARRRRHLAVDHALPHARRSAAARKGARAHRPGGRSGHRVRAARADD
ncbi:MAG: hypothetical protein DMF96_21890 [Acidobacteria bacterium]|nr:MAG: hypothetical protein DMF96_21890 [Acidobacteriota bacterium]